MNYRYIADVVIEAKTPLRLGSGKNDLLQDSPVQKDWNGLPLILGSSIAGIMKEAWDENNQDDLFGYQVDEKDEGTGSRIILSNGLLLDENSNVCEGYLANTSPLLKLYENLPIREHVAINDKGTTSKGAKFDEEIIFKGSRFKFRIELLAESENENDKKIFQKLLNLFTQKGIRLGAGSTKGFGRVAIPEDTILKYLVCQVSSAIYMNLENSLNVTNANFTETVDTSIFVSKKSKALYTLTLKPDAFFMFGSGFGNEDSSADQTQVYEYEIDYNNGQLYAQKLLIPSTSIKGAISHRMAFHYNKKVGATIENGKGKVGEDNDAVAALFGYKKDNDEGQKGRVDFEDVFMTEFSKKIFDHNSIDRFTGGTIDGALFAEETVRTDEEIEFSLEVNEDAFSDEKKSDNIKYAFEEALKDICRGMLPLGGMTTKGHGIFCGKLEKADEVLEDNLSEGGYDDI